MNSLYQRLRYFSQVSPPLFWSSAETHVCEAGDLVLVVDPEIEATSGSVFGSIDAPHCFIAVSNIKAPYC